MPEKAEKDQNMFDVSIELASLPGVSDLFRDYVYGKKSATDFFQNPPYSQDGFKQTAKAVSERDYHREALAAVLLEQNQGWDAGEAALENCKRLEIDSALAVVTGQQVGFLGGPLYSVIKALQAVRLAKSLEEKLKQPVVPIFWLELEDHDVDEVSRFTILDHERQLQPLRIEVEQRKPNIPVNRLPISPSLDEILEQLGKSWLRTEFSDEIFKLLRRSYGVGATLADGFARLFASLLSPYGLVLADPSHRFFKARASDVFEREIAQPLSATEEFREQGKKLLAAHYHNQVIVAEEKLNLYLLDEEEKFRIISAGKHFMLNDPSDVIIREDLETVAESEPERLIPSVLLRPLVQDTLFPTLAYVAGAAEVAYFAQLKPAYRQFDIPMPMIVPRVGITLISGNARRSIEKYKVEVRELFQPAGMLIKHVLSEHVPAQSDLLFNWARQEIRETIDRLRTELDTGESSFAKAAETTAEKIDYHLGKMQDRYIKDLERKHEILVRKIEALSNTVFPDGKLQERVFTIAQFINQYGPKVLQIIYDAIEPLAPIHKLIEVHT